jgi:hypothetical protein
MCSAAEDFPIRLWDRLLRQAEITLNLMQTSRVNPNVSAQEAINGPFDFNKTLLAPPGCKVLIHEKPSQQTSWGPHGVVGWYLGPASEHYRCYWCYVKTTRSERISDMVEFFPKEATMPTITPIESAVMAAEALTAALHQKKLPIHLAEQSDPSNVVLERLAAIYASPTDLGEQSMENPAPSLRVEATSVAGRTRSASTLKEPSEPISLFVNAHVRDVRKGRTTV